MRKTTRELIVRMRKEKNEVSELLSGIQKVHDDPELENALPIRMNEVQSLIAVVKAACENDTYDETFYQEHVYGTMCLLEKRFEDIDVMIEALLSKRTEKSVKAA